MKLENQLDILERLLKLNGNLDSLWSEVSVDGSIEAAIHHEIDELGRKEELAKELYAGKQALLAKRVHRNGSRAQRLADEKRAPRK